MSKQPEVRVERGPVTKAEPFAIGMAKLLEREGRTVAAAELRRLSAVEAQRDALLEACKAYDKWADKTLCYDRELRSLSAQIRAAIKAVEEGK